MNSNQAGRNPNPEDALYTIDLFERDRMLVAARLARSEYAVELLFGAARTLKNLAVSVAEKLRHGTTSRKSSFSH